MLCNGSKVSFILAYLRVRLVLKRNTSSTIYRFDDDVSLEYYRLQKISEGSIDLEEGDARPLDGPGEVGTGEIRESPVPLSHLIDVINERFGTDFNQADQLFFDQLVEAASASDDLKQSALVNSEEKFSLLFSRLLESLFVERMDQNETIFARYMNDAAFQKMVSGYLSQQVYQRLLTETE